MRIIKMRSGKWWDVTNVPAVEITELAAKKKIKESNLVKLEQTRVEGALEEYYGQCELTM